jgi:hypothetical protein
MNDEKLTRRALLERAAMTGAVLVGASALLGACKQDEAGGGGKPAEPKVDCSDLSALTDAEKNTRNSLKYVDKSTKPGQNCKNCKLYKEAPPCGGCEVMKGPIAAEGWCSAWQKLG